MTTEPSTEQLVPDAELPRFRQHPSGGAQIEPGPFGDTFTAAARTDVLATKQMRESNQPGCSDATSHWGWAGRQGVTTAYPGSWTIGSLRYESLRRNDGSDRTA